MLELNFFLTQRERGGGVHRDGATGKGQDQRTSHGDEVSKSKMKAEEQTNRNVLRQTNA